MLIFDIQPIVPTSPGRQFFVDLRVRVAHYTYVVPDVAQRYDDQQHYFIS